MFRRSLLIATSLLASTLAFTQSTRHFDFRYEFTVQSVDAGKELRLWIPMATTDQYQTVKIVRVSGDLPLKKTREKRFGNSMFYASAPAAAGERDYKFSIEYDVIRRERTTLSDADREASKNPGAMTAANQRSPIVRNAAVKEYLKPDKLVPVSGLPAELAVKTVDGRTGDLQKARAIYDYVLANLKYDKSGTGWGRGDTLWVCDAKRGNCTDFHSLFISMARSQQIPARFEIGFPLPASKHEAEIAGYHCWAEFYAAGKGWVPIDISEAWKDQSKSAYFFGAHDSNRIQFSIGRDLVLSPAQAGDPLNYFVYPYVEVGGKKYENVSNRFSFADVTQEKQIAAENAR